MQENKINILIEEFINYVDLEQYFLGYHFYFIDKANFSAIHEYNNDSSLKFDFESILELTENVTSVFNHKSISVYKVERSLVEQKRKANTINSRTFVVKITPFDSTQNSKNSIFIVLISEENDSVINDYLLQKEYIFRSALGNVLNKLYADENIFEIIDIFTEMVEKKDSYMPYHMVNVSGYAIKIALKMQLGLSDLEKLRVACAMQNIGNIFISDEIFSKKSALNSEELVMIKEHPKYGSRLISATLSNHESYEDIAEIILMHHENYDGTGYPNKVLGEDIHLLSRIIRVADSIDAMASVRSYKDKSSTSQIIDELERFSGSLFDPVIVEHAIEVLKELVKSEFNLTDIESEVLTNSSLSYVDFIKQRHFALSGSFQVIGNKGVFKYRLIDDKDISTDNFVNTRATVIFMRNRIIYELTCRIIGHSDGKFLLDNIEVRPNEKYFSMAWKSECLVQKNGVKSVVAKVTELGASGAVLEVNNSVAEVSNLLSLDDRLIIKFDEIVDGLHFELTLNARLINLYQVYNRIYLICNYVDVKQSETDLIFKVLFRRQSESRRIV